MFSFCELLSIPLFNHEFFHAIIYSSVLQCRGTGLLTLKRCSGSHLRFKADNLGNFRSPYQATGPSSPRAYYIAELVILKLQVDGFLAHVRIDCQLVKAACLGEFLSTEGRKLVHSIVQSAIGIEAFNVPFVQRISKVGYYDSPDQTYMYVFTSR